MLSRKVIRQSFTVLNMYKRLIFVTRFADKRPSAVLTRNYIIQLGTAKGKMEDISSKLKCRSGRAKIIVRVVSVKDNDDRVVFGLQVKRRWEEYFQAPMNDGAADSDDPADRVGVFCGTGM